MYIRRTIKTSAGIMRLEHPPEPVSVRLYPHEVDALARALDRQATELIEQGYVVAGDRLATRAADLRRVA